MRWRRCVGNGWGRAVQARHVRLCCLAGCAIAAVLLAGCGIPEFAYLAPPIPGTVTELPPTVTFSHSIDNNTDSFLGYELYYKFYDPETGENLFRADRTAIQNAAAGAVASTITGRGYRRVQRRVSDAKPVLAVAAADRGIPFTVRVEFQQGAQTGAVASWTAVAPRAVLLVRNQAALGNPTPPLGFAEEDLVPGVHQDLGGLEPSALGLRMGLVIVSYGIDFATGRFAEIYSTAIVPENQLRMFH